MMNTSKFQTSFVQFLQFHEQSQKKKMEDHLNREAMLALLKLIACEVEDSAVANSPEGSLIDWKAKEENLTKLREEPRRYLDVLQKIETRLHGVIVDDILERMRVEKDNAAEIRRTNKGNGDQRSKKIKVEANIFDCTNCN